MSVQFKVKFVVGYCKRHTMFEINKNRETRGKEDVKQHVRDRLHVPGNCFWFFVVPII